VHAPQTSYQQEWWYLTANLTTEQGQSLASQWTLFRRAVGNKHWYFAHAALADANEHQSAYRNGRIALGNVSMNTEPFSATIDDWQWQSSAALLPATLRYGSAVGSIPVTPPLVTKPSEISSHSANLGPAPLNQTAINQPTPKRPKATAKTSVKSKANNDWQVELELTSNEDFFLQGDNGYSRKHPNLDIASHYYSQPFIDVTGQVFWQGQWQKVTGKAWFDREWASQMLAPDQQGWDWFSLRLDENKALMVFRLRSSDNDYFYASIMERGGAIRSIANHDIVLLSSVSTASKTSQYPNQFSLTIAKEAIDIKVQVVNEQQIMRFGIEYFEGMVTFDGSHHGQGFVEMTGYDK
jgi:predicted secreted hydrolase